MAFNVDDFLSSRTARTATVRVASRNDLFDRLTALYNDRDAAKRTDEMENRPPEAPKIAEEIEAVKREIEETSVEFKFQAVSRAVYDGLLREHSQSDGDVDMDGFYVALIAASCVDPKLSTDDAQRLYDELLPREVKRMVADVTNLHLRGGDFPLLYSGTGPTPTTGQKSGTADPEGSPEASS